MMLAFILALGLSFWKLYMFMPNKPLADDDTTKESIEELTHLLYKNMSVIEVPLLDNKSLYESIISDNNFDKKHFWRFNENRLHQLLEQQYLKYNITDTSDEFSNPHPRIHQLKSLSLHHQK